jgi:chemotaxis protein methyltransferase CheR
VTAPLEQWDVRLRSLFGLSLLRHPARLRDGLRAACKELGIDSDSALLVRVDDGDVVAKTALARALTIGETYFFREPAHFDLLRDELLPSAIAHRSDPVVLVSAACASGEEAYSMAIVARQALGAAATQRVRVLGIDVNEKAIVAARRAEYRAWSLRGVPDAVRSRWLVRTDETWRVKPDTRSLVTFERRNLVDPADELPPASADVIFCRNVLIYLDDEHVAMVLRSLSRALRPKGSLVVSSAEAALLALAGLAAHQRGDIWVHCPGEELPRATAGAKAAATSVENATTNDHVKAPPSYAARPARAPRATPIAPATRATSDPGATDGTPAKAAHDDVSTVLELGWASLPTAPISAGVAARRAILLDRTLAAAHVLAASAAVAQGDARSARSALRNARRHLSDVPPGEIVCGGGGATAAELQSYCARLERALAGRSR